MPNHGCVNSQVTPRPFHWMLRVPECFHSICCLDYTFVRSWFNFFSCHDGEACVAGSPSQACFDSSDSASSSYPAAAQGNRAEACKTCSHYFSILRMTVGWYCLNPVRSFRYSEYRALGNDSRRSTKEFVRHFRCRAPPRADVAVTSSESPMPHETNLLCAKFPSDCVPSSTDESREPMQHQALRRCIMNCCSDLITQRGGTWACIVTRVFNY